jgi:predicted amidophosphoribosyltransferase
MYCLKCGNPIYSTTATCINCGFDPNTNMLTHMVAMQNPKYCPSCRKDNPPFANYCMRCGSSLETLVDKFKKFFKK